MQKMFILQVILLEFPAKNFGLDDYDLQMIHIVGHLHYIGKIGVSDNILNKKDKLNDFEWELMKGHPEMGYNIV